MAIDHPIPELDRNGLRKFGLTTGGIVAVLFGLFFPWILERALPLWPWIFFGVLAGAGVLVPLALKPVYVTWMKFGLLASRVTTPLILGTVFFIVISPIGLFRRLLGHDDMRRSFEKGADTYRVASAHNPIENMEKPF